MSRNDILRTGLDAWNELTQCGLELDGRDVDFANALRMALDSSASSLEGALSNCTTESFVRAFLATAEPYVQMLSGILRMFELAGAKRGQGQWRIAFNDYIAEVEHFKQWEQIFASIGTQLEYPALTQRGWWGLMDALRVSPITERIGDSRGAFWDFQQTWASLSEAKPDSEPWMNDLSAIVDRAQQVLADAGLNLVTAREGQWHIDYDPDGDGFALNRLRSLQHDYQVSQLIAAYEVLWADRDAQRIVGDDIAAHLKSFPRHTFRSKAAVDELRPFLALPIWQKRHEFYAAWVASEQIDVLRDAGIRVHSQNETITFPFRETCVATLQDVGVTMISERRSPLDEPLGSGRKGSVQPDYGWWQSQVADSELCSLVVEVKHYKKAARAKWIEVLSDYARAHPSADVVLVNYGPAGHAEANVAEELRSRCHVIGDLRPNSMTAIERFRNIVALRLRYLSKSPRAILLDVSPSMEIDRRRLALALKELAIAHGCSELLAVDDEIVKRLDTMTLLDDQLVALPRQRVEELSGPLLTALDNCDVTVLVTDDSGCSSIKKDARFNLKPVTGVTLDDDLVALEVRKR